MGTLYQMMTTKKLVNINQDEQSDLKAIGQHKEKEPNMEENENNASEFTGVMEYNQDNTSSNIMETTGVTENDDVNNRNTHGARNPKIHDNTRY